MNNILQISKYNKISMELFNPILPQKDVILLICSFLSDKNKLYFLSTCKIAHTFKKYIVYKNLVDLDKILRLDYYDQFINICATRFNIIKMKQYNKNFPENMSMIKLFLYKKCVYSLLKDCKYLVHIIFDNGCRVINGICLNNIKHITWNIEQDIHYHYFSENLLSLQIGSEPKYCHIPNTIERLVIIDESKYHLTRLTNLKILVVNGYGFFNMCHFLDNCPKKLEILVLKYKAPAWYQIEQNFNVPKNLILVLNNINEAYFKSHGGNNESDDFNNFIKLYHWKLEWKNLTEMNY